MKYPKDLTGLHIGDWEVLEKADGYKWKCRCSCGTIKDVFRNNLVSHKSTSCGHNSKKDKLLDLSNMQVGELVVLEYNKELKKWKCRCSCGNITYKRSWDLRNNKAITCGDTSKHRSNRLNDLTDKVFGELIVLEYSIEHEKWKCKCSCGKEVYVRAADLKRNNKLSCGHTLNQNKVIDIKGQIFGELEAIERDPITKKWKCKCSCGKYRLVDVTKLRNGSITSCGHEYNPLIDITNKQFGYLKVLEYNKKINMWLCECKCGNRKYVYSQHLRRGDTTSCGCSKSNSSIKDIEIAIKELNQNLNRLPYAFEIADRLNCTESYIRNKIKDKYGNTNILNKKINKSKFEIEVLNFVRSICNKDILDKILENNRYILDGLEVDIATPLVLIECNGVYYHSTIFKNMEYHQNKVISAYNQGMRLIHIYENEWINHKTRNIIEKYLCNIFNSSSIEKIYAKNTYITELDDNSTKEFLDTNHLQGYTNSLIKIALRNKINNEVISVMTFSKPRFENEIDYELVRYCSKLCTRIVGGSQKLFWYFINNYKPKSIVAYSNIDKFSGNMYTNLGFKFIELTKSSYFWTDHRCKNVFNSYQTQKEELVKLGLGREDQTEDEIMEGLNYFKVYNSGNLKFIWEES